MSAKRRNKFDKGAWAVQRERFQFAEKTPPTAFAPTAMRDVVPDIMKRMGLDGLIAGSAITDEWAAIVGEGIAGHTRPGRMEHGVLTVFVNHSAWLSELSRYGKKEMMRKLNERFGKGFVNRISLLLDPGD